MSLEAARRNLSIARCDDNINTAQLINNLATFNYDPQYLWGIDGVKSRQTSVNISKSFNFEDKTYYVCDLSGIMKPDLIDNIECNGRTYCFMNSSWVTVYPGIIPVCSTFFTLMLLIECDLNEKLEISFDQYILDMPQYVAFSRMLYDLLEERVPIGEWAYDVFSQEFFDKLYEKTI